MKKFLIRMALKLLTDQQIKTLYLAVHMRIVPAFQKEQYAYWVAEGTVLGGAAEEAYKEQGHGLAAYFHKEVTSLLELRTLILESRPKLFKGYEKLITNQNALTIMHYSPTWKAYCKICEDREKEREKVEKKLAAKK